MNTEQFSAKLPACSRRDFLTCLGMGAVGLYATPACLATTTPKLPAKEAMFWESLPENRVRCLLCPKSCVVAEGQRGFCRVRENRNGRYMTLVYGSPCAIHPHDPIEKKPFFHVFPGTRAFSMATTGCNMTCTFCQNWEIAQISPEAAPGTPLSPEQAAARAKASGARTMAYTYNEPTIFYEYMLDCARAGLEQGIDSVIVSNGFIEAQPQRELFPHVKAIKIDFKAFSSDFYRNVCSAELQPVLETLKRLAGSGVWFEIVTLLIPGLNDSSDEIKRMTEWIVKEVGSNVPLHFSRFHPAYKLRNLPSTPLETLLRARTQAKAQGCNYVYIGNAPGQEGQNTFCHNCSALLIERYGYRIIANALVAGACPACKTAIPGVWH